MNSLQQTPSQRANSAIDLSRFDHLVQTDTHTPLRRNDLLPDGSYEVRIENAELTVSARSGNPVLKYTLRILGPSFTNFMMWKYRGITENTIHYIKDELEICGLKLDRFSELSNRLHELIDLKLEVFRKTRGEDTSIYFKRLIGREEEPIDDDDLPF
ncbi:DUF669 domain-containing protein [Bryobacter aggregatus]|uniref:DUF669 domain-containing protein n=1 Tax=Bryobacter aggregatus TaxID=360054 RepID=UPI0004E24A44|nr:DUF669 domain-containing protein [Bryobacter aggregatus]